MGQATCTAFEDHIYSSRRLSCAIPERINSHLRFSSLLARHASPYELELNALIRYVVSKCTIIRYVVSNEGYKPGSLAAERQPSGRGHHSETRVQIELVHRLGAANPGVLDDRISSDEYPGSLDAREGRAICGHELGL